jgi:hypothetical protein
VYDVERRVKVARRKDLEINLEEDQIGEEHKGK